MGRRGDGYGSEDHLLRYRKDHPDALDREILREITVAGASIDWVYPPRVLPKGSREPQGLSFLPNDNNVKAKWRAFWPQRGMQQNWDGVARLQAPGRDDEWLLVEAKANHPEFCSGPCQASKTGGYTLIQRSIGETKRYLGVHRDFPWLGTYYQYCNRLACLYFLQVKSQIPTRLVGLYFTGDSFPDKRRCPASAEDWRELIRARELTLGLPNNHPLARRILDVFVSVVPVSNG